MNDVVRRVLDEARTQIGVHEIGTSNTGREVDMYLRAAGCSPGNPWCASFVYWCVHETVPDDPPFIRTASCAVIDAWARDKEILFDTPQPGDVFLIYGTVQGVFRAHHTGFVESVDGGAFGTVEGNTNLGGSREGTSVLARKRFNSNGVKFVRWGALAAPAATQEFYTLKLDGCPPVPMPVIDGRSMCPVRVWGEMMGFQVDWNDEKQVPLLDGHEVSTQVSLIDGRAYAPVRDLFASAGLKLHVDVPTHFVTVEK